VTCRECADFLADYLEDELDTAVREEFERHLTRCPNCIAYVEQYRVTIVAGQRACQEETSVDALDVPEDLIKAILAARK
jgi:anti-sigma factor RsiW